MPSEMTSDELAVRRRRALWRSGHRGTKELDLMIGGYAAAHMGSMTSAQLDRFEAFLALEEAALQTWLLAPEPAADVPCADIVNAVRAFHGLKSAV